MFRKLLQSGVELIGLPNGKKLVGFKCCSSYIKAICELYDIAECFFQKPSNIQNVFSQRQVFKSTLVVIVTWFHWTNSLFGVPYATFVSSKETTSELHPIFEGNLSFYLRHYTSGLIRLNSKGIIKKIYIGRHLTFAHLDRIDLLIKSWSDHIVCIVVFFWQVRCHVQ